MEWQLKTMADIAEPVNGIVDGPFGSNLKKSDYIDDSENGIPVLTTKNLHGDYSKDSVRYISKEKYEVIKRSTVYPGDILVAKIGSIGTCGIYPLSCKNALIPANLLKITVLPTVDRKYVYYYIQSRGFQEKIKAISTATAQPAFNVTKFRKLPIPTPPLPEQERIVARIEELFSQLDAGVETLKKTKAQLAVYRQAVLKEAFEGRLTASGPEKIVRLGDYIETPRYGTSKKCSYGDGRDRTAVYRIPNIEHKNGRISHDDIKYAQFTESELDGIRLQQGDILIIRSNGSVSLVGRAAMVCDTDITGTFAGYLMRLRISEPETLLPKFLLLFLQSHQARIYIENKAKSTSGVHNINSTEISDLHLPLYDLDTQYAIIEAIESRLSVCDSIEQTVDTALQQAEAMRQSILKQAFGGAL